jgi:hypothetical protein
MVLDGFGSSIGLVWIIVSSLLVNHFVLCGATILVLCRAITLELFGATTHGLCEATTLILCGAHRPLWLPYRLIG